MSIEELEVFFAENPIPDGTVLYQGTTIVNGEKFLKSALIAIKCWNGYIENCPSYWRLKDMANILSAQKPL